MQIIDAGFHSYLLGRSLLHFYDLEKISNGEGEIRTPGGFSLIRFQVGRNRPLCHLSSKLSSLLLTWYANAFLD
jgi:hypothetical protein